MLPISPQDSRDRDPNGQPPDTPNRRPLSVPRSPLFREQSHKTHSTSQHVLCMPMPIPPSCLGRANDVSSWQLLCEKRLSTTERHQSSPNLLDIESRIIFRGWSVHRS